MSEENKKEQEQIVVTVVESEGERYHLETLLHEVLDRTYLVGMMLEESVVSHPYFKVGPGKGRAREALTAVWNLYQYLGTAEANLIESNNKDSKLWTHTVSITDGKTSDHD
jgi:hypothetical protein